MKTRKPKTPKAKTPKEKKLPNKTVRVYFLHPDELFSAISKKGNIKIDGNDTEATGNFILEDLQSILNAIEQSTMGNESEDDFNKLFEDIDLASTKLGRTPAARK